MEEQPTGRGKHQHLNGSVRQLVCFACGIVTEHLVVEDGQFDHANAQCRKCFRWREFAGDLVETVRCLRAERRVFV